MVRSGTAPDARTTAPVILPGVVLLLLDRIDLPIGISKAEQMLCSSGFNIGQLVVLGLGMISAYFLLKAVIRAVNRQVRGGAYSLVAGILPLCIPTALTVLGVDTTCLLPW
ncbi:hypothetical protein [Halocatena pleomorpha]|uniref:Uncharacterized protein n=1 Tax=Halocatena pleomorpha TaxID=1785090 RepID=A0A3P3RC49_9EURY|nr:hypothetical protein [Halocatena pleomorpha]RRJ31031.1 hypothetical protein EIK79_08465 [Halocatena pleomorpha]